MIKLKILILSFFVVTMILMTQLIKVYAIDDAWKEVPICENNLGLVTFKQADSLGLLDGSKRSLAQVVIEEKYDNYCVDTKLVNGITEVQGRFLGLKIQKDIEYCGNENGIKYYLGMRRADAGDPNNVRCCPEGFPYIRGMGLICCKSEAPAACSLLPNLTCLTTGCNSTYGKEGFYSDLGEEPFPKATVGYSCEETNCFTNKSNELIENEKRINLSSIEKSKYFCYASVGVAMSVPPELVVPGDQVCFNGKFISKAEYERWGSLIGLYASCMDSPNPSERERCAKCYEPCIGYDACPLIYNSMGCVDTNPQGLITRVFQIGIGVIGAVGIVRVMQAAFMRQSGDPAKLKESYDIISSVVIGAILLIFGIVILRFIGINVLQILPFDFLQ